MIYVEHLERLDPMEDLEIPDGVVILVLPVYREDQEMQELFPDYPDILECLELRENAETRVLMADLLDQQTRADVEDPEVAEEDRE